MRLSSVIPVLGTALLAGCAGTPATPDPRQAVVGSNIPGNATAGPTSTVSEAELNRQGGVSTASVLQHTSAWSYLGH